MKKSLCADNNRLTLISGGLLLLGLYLASLYNYLLFHSLAEIFSIVIAFCIFILAWNCRDLIDNNYLIFLGIAYLFVGFLDTIHTLAYTGMGVFKGYDSNLPTQLWITARYLESISLLIAYFIIERRKIKINFILLGYTIIVSLLFLSIFYWKIFPACFIEGSGLTPFKKISEYIISLILVVSLFFLLKKKDKFDRKVLHWLVISILLTIASELAFTFYISVYGLSNLIGHIFKIISFYFIYRAIVVTGLTKPNELLFRNLKESEEKFQELDQLKSMFIASMSHELRTPLNSIIGFTGIILQGMSGEINQEQRKQLSLVKSSANHLLDLINDVIDISKIEADKIELYIQEFDLSLLAQEIKESFAVVADRKGLVLLLEAPPKLLIKSDKKRTKQILVNFISNALKFTDQGEIEIKVSQKDETAVISVRDTGIGIKKEDIDKLFNAFSRISNPDRIEEGTGLGLYLSKKIANLLGGDITAKSEFGKGSVFTLTLPLKYKEVKE
jgi:signal transduction histidine kinase